MIYCANCSFSYLFIFLNEQRKQVKLKQRPFNGNKISIISHCIRVESKHPLGFNHNVIQFSLAKIYIQNTTYISFKTDFVFC